jgi:hypothetical protein
MYSGHTGWITYFTRVFLVPVRRHGNSMPL